jgi:translocation and assembly module TamB
MKIHTGKILKVSLKVLLWILSTVLIIIIAALIFIRTEKGQNLIRRKAVSYLSEKLGTHVAIGKFRTDLLTHIEIQGIQLTDQSAKPMLNVGKIDIEYTLAALLHNTLSIRNIEIDTLYFRMARNETDSAYNFDFILSAFSGPPSPDSPAPETGSPMKFDIGELNIKQLHFVMDDRHGKQSYDVRSNLIAAEADVLDLEKQKYTLKKLETEGLLANLSIGSSGPSTEDTSSGVLPIVAAAKIILRNSRITIQMPESGFRSESRWKEFSVSGLTADLNTLDIALSEVRLAEHQSTIVMKSTGPETTVVQPVSQSVSASVADEPPMKVQIGSLVLLDNNLAYDTDKPRMGKASDFDPDHIHVQNLQLTLQNFTMEGSTFRGTVENLYADEQCGFSIAEMTTGFYYADTTLKLEKLTLNTPFSAIDGDFRLSYKSIDAISKDPASLGFGIDLKNMKLASRDMLHFRNMAGNDPEISKYLSKDIALKARMEGTLGKMKIDELKLRIDQEYLSASGTIAGLPDPDRLLASIRLQEFSGTTKSLSGLLPEGTIPPDIAPGERFRISGKLGDAKGAYTFDLTMNSTAGDLALKGMVTQIKTDEQFIYDVQAFSEGLQIDRILMDTLYGNTAFDMHIEGRGISPETADARVEANLPFAYYQGHSYTGIDLKAALEAALLDARLQISDSACMVNLTATYSLDSLNPCLKADGSLGNIDLYQLGFASDTLTIRADLTADFTTLNAKHLNGNLSIPHLEVLSSLGLHPLDSINLETVYKDTLQTISLRTPVMDLSLDGTYEIDALPVVAQSLFFDYMTVYPPTAPSKIPADAHLLGEFRYNPVLASFVPDLKAMDTVKFEAKLNTVEKELWLGILAPSTKYSDYIIDTTIFLIHTTQDTLFYSFGTAGIQSPSLSLYESLIHGSAKDGSIQWDVKLYNKLNQLRYDLAGLFINDTTRFILNLDENQLINAEKWTTNKGNSIEYNPDRIHCDLELSSGDRRLALQTSDGESGLPLDLKLTQFPLTTLTKIIQSDSTLAEGIINGKVRITEIDPLQFSGDLAVDSLKTFEVMVGNLKMKANTTPDDGYSAEATLIGDANDLDLKARYSGDGSLDGKVNIRKFDLRTIHPFVEDMIIGLQGSVSGGIDVSGTASNPDLQGELQLKDVQGTYHDYSTYFRIPEGRVELNENGINIPELVVYDSTGNTARLKGQFQLTGIGHYSYDLGVKTSHFMAMSKKTHPDQEYYGPAYFTSDLSITGSDELVLVKGQVKVDDKSEINVVMSSIDTAVSNSTGIIVYIDSLQTSDSIIESKLKSDLQKVIPSMQIGLALNTEITKTSKLTIYLDKSGGDYLKVAGDASLTVSQHPGGDMNLQGKYTVENGEYQMTLSRVLKRKFAVKKGSSIQWSGAPTDATIDMTALYTVKTSAEAIMNGSQSSNPGAAKQSFPFEVYLILKNKMMQPTISFKLDMDEKDQNAFGGTVYSRIKQINMNESELNKQVMGLLLINQFIPNDPFASGSGSYSLINYESAARSTAGSIVSQQLNSLVSSRVKQVDLEFAIDSKSDYTSGSKSNETDLSINLSKSLFNDRYTVSVGSTFALEGSEEHRQNAAGLAGNFSLEYKITDDGRYRAKAYRKDVYDFDNTGQVWQTGVSLLMFVDFNKYREFMPKKDSRKK